MDFENITNLISSIGFPIFVAVWMLYKSSNDSKELTAAINQLENAILDLKAYIQNNGV